MLKPDYTMTLSERAMDRRIRRGKPLSLRYRYGRGT
jgi:hypothetical protein